MMARMRSGLSRLDPGLRCPVAAGHWPRAARPSIRGGFLRKELQSWGESEWLQEKQAELTQSLSVRAPGLERRDGPLHLQPASSFGRVEPIRAEQGGGLES